MGAPLDETLNDFLFSVTGFAALDTNFGSVCSGAANSELDEWRYDPAIGH